MNMFKNLEALKKRMEALQGKSVVVGVLSGNASQKEKGSDITLLEKAVIHEFGAEIEHNGGTAYGYRSEKDAKSGKVRFMKSGAGYMSLGKTGKHTIKIPERSFLRSTFSKEKAATAKIIAVRAIKYLENGGDPNSPFAKAGKYLQGKVQDKINSGEFTPLSKSTIRAKKSSKPLVDKGQLIQGIHFEVRDES